MTTSDEQAPPAQTPPAQDPPAQDSPAQSEGGNQQMIMPAAVAVQAPAADGDSSVMAQVEQPAKVMRIGTMVKQLLEEVRSAPLDEAGRARLKEIHQRSIDELEDGLAPELRAELDRLSLPFDGDRIPSEAELRVAQAQLVGWLEGLFHGIQTALIAQQMAARAQLEQMRGRALPPGAGDGSGGGVTLFPALEQQGGTGQYL